jgi:predicted outer membrane repeat protein
VWFSSWQRNWNRSAFAARRHTSPCRRTSFRPRLEVLEDRWLLSPLTVTSTADDGSVGTLRYEIAKAQSGDSINFASSLKGQTITLSGTELYIDKNLNIQGLGASNLAISSGNQSRVFEVAGGAQVQLSGMTIEHGAALPGDNVLWDSGLSDGGGILNWGMLTLSGDTLSDNVADYGGGLANAYGGTVTVTASTVSGNQATYGGGGIYNDGAMTLSGSTVTQNFSWNAGGGGIYNDYRGVLTILDSVVQGNSPDDLYNLGTWTHKQSHIGTVDG